jgi:hypothetical protein
MEAAWVEPWLERRSGHELVRAAVFAAAQSCFAEHRDAGSAKLLLAALEQGDLELQTQAFRALAGAEDWSSFCAPLHAVWSRQAIEVRRSWLRHLRRDQAAAPFRRDLLLWGRDPGLRAEVLELLGAFQGDAEVLEFARIWLAEALDALGRTSEVDPVPAALEQSAAAALRAGWRAGGESAVLMLIDALEATEGRSIEVAKLAANYLGQTALGRRELAQWLADDVPLRVRVEAGLALAARWEEGAGERARARLERDFGRCDFDLRARIVRCLAGLEDQASWEFLRDLAHGEDQDAPLRELAIDALAARGPRSFEALAELARQARSPELRGSALSALAKLGGERVEGLLLDRLEVLERQGPDAQGDAVWEFEREQVLQALARVGGLGPAALAAWLRRPLAAADGEMAQRFRGERAAPVAFVYRGELALASALARAGLLRLALEQAGEYSALDARLLAALAECALEHDLESARRLWTAAWVALESEGESEDRSELRVGVRSGLFLTAWRSEDWASAADHARRLLADWRAERVSERAFAARFGEFDPQRGSDPQAELECAELQARALVAFGRGEREPALVLAARARARMGHSAQARARQEWLEARW